MAVTGAAVAFLSYAHIDDEHDGGTITAFRKALEGEIRVQTGQRDARIFQDRDDIAWGQAWLERIDSSLDAVTFLVPMLTPSFFASEQCRRELRRFLARERQLGRDDLILPVYWISTPVLDDPARYASDDLARELRRRQYTDWRELRFRRPDDLGGRDVRRALAELAIHIRNTLADTTVLDTVDTGVPDAVGKGVPDAVDAAGRERDGGRRAPGTPEDRIAVERRADERLALIHDIRDLLGLSKNPRMLSFIAELPEADLVAAKSADGTISSADLYRALVDRWLGFEVDRRHPTRGAVRSLLADQLHTAAIRIAVRLWTRGEQFLELADLDAVVRAVLPELGPTKLNPPTPSFLATALIAPVRWPDSLRTSKTIRPARSRSSAG